MTYNIGTTDEYSIHEISHIISSKLGIAKAITYIEDRPFNDRRYSVSDARLRALGWYQRVSWEDGIDKTISWYKKNHEEYRIILNPYNNT